LRVRIFNLILYSVCLIALALYAIKAYMSHETLLGIASIGSWMIVVAIRGAIDFRRNFVEKDQITEKNEAKVAVSGSSWQDKLPLIAVFAVFSIPLVLLLIISLDDMRHGTKYVVNDSTHTLLSVASILIAVSYLIQSIFCVSRKSYSRIAVNFVWMLAVISFFTFI
jgi:hypothetical protein